MALEDVVDDQEQLYRSLKIGQQCVKENGKWRPTSLAFSDRYKKPSVDRAVLRGNNPANSKKSKTDGVVLLYASEARTTKLEGYELDVISDPIINHETLAYNPAHALIVPNKEYASDKHYRKIIERLGKLVEKHGWLIEPTENV